MSAPRIKRQFAGAASDPSQRHITSFFTAPTTSNTTAGTAPSSCYSPNTSTPSSATTSTTYHSSHLPNLPATVQANLLSVGMRVRKSVPEGYKTGDYNAFALWDESSDAVPNLEIMGEGQRSRANAFSSPRELLPFCGIHKVGGLDTQQRDGGGSGSSGRRPVPSMPGLISSSQESVESNASASSSFSDMAQPSRKRFFVEDENDEDDFAAQLDFWRFNHSLSSFGSRDLAPPPPAATAHNSNHSGRAIAIPSKGRLLRAKYSGAAATAADRGNMMVVDSDFEDAEFLDRGVLEVDMNDA
jgi:hypothetical protein